MTRSTFLFKHWLLLVAVAILYMACGSASAPSTPAQIPTEGEYATFELSMQTSNAVSANLSVKSGSVACGEESADHAGDGETAYCYTPLNHVVALSKMEIVACHDTADSASDSVACELSTPNAQSGGVAVGGDGTIDSAEFVTIWDADTTDAANVETYTDQDSVVRNIRMVQMRDDVAVVPGTEEVTDFDGYSAGRFTITTLFYVLPEDNGLGEMSGGLFQRVVSPFGCFDIGDPSDLSVQSTYRMKSECERGDILFDPEADGIFSWFDLDSNQLSDTRPANPKVSSSKVNGPTTNPNEYDADGVNMGTIINSASDPILDIILGGSYSMDFTFDVEGLVEVIDTDGDGIFSFEVDRIGDVDTNTQLILE